MEGTHVEDGLLPPSNKIAKGTKKKREMQIVEDPYNVHTHSVHVSPTSQWGDGVFDNRR
jgi:hypothetical protein